MQLHAYLKSHVHASNILLFILASIVCLEHSLSKHHKQILEQDPLSSQDPLVKNHFISKFSNRVHFHHRIHSRSITSKLTRKMERQQARLSIAVSLSPSLSSSQTSLKLINLFNSKKNETETLGNLCVYRTHGSTDDSSLD